MQTGGGHFMLTERDDVNSTFTRVANELHQQYVLGFSLQKFDGKPHALDVVVSRAGHDGAGAQELPRAAADRDVAESP